MKQILGRNAIPLKEVIKRTYQTTKDCLRMKVQIVCKTPMNV